MEGRQKTENGGQIDSAEFCHLTSDPCHLSSVDYQNWIMVVNKKERGQRPENRLTVLNSVLCFLTSDLCYLTSVLCFPVILFDIQLLPGINCTARVQLV